jgi:restriction endonuclease Mrr
MFLTCHFHSVICRPQGVEVTDVLAATEEAARQQQERQQQQQQQQQQRRHAAAAASKSKTLAQQLLKVGVSSSSRHLHTIPLLCMSCDAVML